MIVLEVCIFMNSRSNDLKKWDKTHDLQSTYLAVRRTRAFRKGRYIMFIHSFNLI